MADKDVDVDLNAGTVICVPDKGNCQVQRGDQIRWKKLVAGKGIQFRLRFRVEPVNGVERPASAWPFGDDPPPQSGTTETAWVERFDGRAQLSGVFEYTVEVRDETGAVFALDPMIIVRT
jgi:hypothetical protein